MGTIQDTTMISALCRSQISSCSPLMPVQNIRENAAMNIVYEVESYIEMHLAEPITIAKLCIATGYPLHTLERLFKKTYAITPKQFLTYKRLTAMRHLLLQHTPEELSVTDAAVRCGLTHLGRTAVNYKLTFGETPSNTLRKINRKQRI